MIQRRELGDRECEYATRLNAAAAFTPYFYENYWGNEGARGSLLLPSQPLPRSTRAFFQAPASAPLNLVSLPSLLRFFHAAAAAGLFFAWQQCCDGSLKDEIAALPPGRKSAAERLRAARPRCVGGGGIRASGGHHPLCALLRPFPTGVPLLAQRTLHCLMRMNSSGSVQCSAATMHCNRVAVVAPSPPQDIKTDNLLINSADDSRPVLLADFNLAREPPPLISAAAAAAGQNERSSKTSPCLPHRATPILPSVLHPP